MELKKFTLILVFLFISINTNSQEKQNDATWEETIGFIKENIELSDCTLRWKKSVDTEYYPCNYEFTGEQMIETTKLVNRKYNGTIVTTKSLRFKEIINVEIVEGEFYNLNILTNEGMVKVTATTTMNGKTDRSKRIFSNFSILFSNKGIAERFQKAIKHLAYLAKIKQEKSKF